jgi:hypothetical protein
LREGARGRGNLKGELFTLTLTLSRQGRGNYFKISKSGFGTSIGVDNIRVDNTLPFVYL